MAKTWILLRGLIREQRHWGQFATEMQKAFPGDRIIMLDLPGNGARCRETSPASIADMVESLRQQYNAIGIDGPIHMIALSLGGMIAVQWLSQYPQEFAFAALINSSAKPFSPAWRRLRPGNYGTILNLLCTKPSAEKRERAIIAMTTARQSPDRQQVLAAEWAEYARTHPVSRSNTRRQLRAAMRFRAPQHLPEGVPVVIVNSAADHLVHPSCSQRLAEAWSCPLLTHPDAGHDLPLDDPHWLLQQLKRHAP